MIYFAETIVGYIPRVVHRKKRLVSEYANGRLGRKAFLREVEELTIRENDRSETCGPRHLVKVGFSDDPWARVHQLRDRYGQGLRLLNVMWGGEFAEMAVHDLLAPYRRHGEWFYPTPEVFAFAENPDLRAVRAQMEWLASGVGTAMQAPSSPVHSR